MRLCVSECSDRGVLSLKLNKNRACMKPVVWVCVCLIVDSVGARKEKLARVSLTARCVRACVCGCTVVVAGLNARS